MPQILIPLPETDYQVMNTSHNGFFEITQHLPQDTQYYVINATHRLAEVDWITYKLEEQIRARGAPIVQEDLLSLQLYLLLTCADALGHIYITDGVSKRFRKFFDKLPQEAKQNLTDNIFTWKTDFAELVRLGLGDASINTASYPSRQQVMDFLQPLFPNERLKAIVDFFYVMRNCHTHESEYPQLGYHPTLSVMQNQRLNVSNVATLGALDRLHPISSGNDIYFTYYENNDVIATLRWSIVRGLGKIVGCI